MLTPIWRSHGDTDDGFVVTTDAGPSHCDDVVVATGTFGRTPLIPDCVSALGRSILQLHSSEDRRPGQPREGPVLVAGASLRHGYRLRTGAYPTDDPCRT